MKALRKLSSGSGNVVLLDTPVPTISEEQVLVKVKKAGICGTDIHIFHGRFPKVRPPVTLGHEFSGTVEKVGKKVKEWEIGERVTVESEAFSCGKCLYCINGNTNLCPKRLAYGYSLDGGFAPFVAVRHTALHRLPDHITFEEGAICEPLAVAVHAVLEKASISPKDKVLIIGPGPIGLLILKVAKIKGAQVFITGKKEDQERLRFAKYIGANDVFISEDRDLEKLISDLTNGIGFDVIFECSGGASSINDGLGLIKRLGTLIMVGLYGNPIEVELDEIIFKEVYLRGSFGHNHETWNKMIDFLEQEKPNLKAFISGDFLLEDWQDAFKASESGKGVKYLITPTD